jgi:hypothetical protein
MPKPSQSPTLREELRKAVEAIHYRQRGFAIGHPFGYGVGEMKFFCLGHLLRYSYGDLRGL